MVQNNAICFIRLLGWRRYNSWRFESRDDYRRFDRTDFSAAQTRFMGEHRTGSSRSPATGKKVCLFLQIKYFCSFKTIQL
jgi:hypothetical protein